jgi:tetratricopeptide (TPR) repeat protein
MAMAIRGILAGLLVSAALSGPASAYVVSYGRSNAAACAEHAADTRSLDVEPCNRALADAPSDQEKVVTLVNRGIIYRRIGDLQVALDDFNAAVDLNPELADAYLNRGTLYYLAGYQDRAIADYEKALALGFERPWLAWYNIGVSYEEKGDAAKAKQAYNKAIDANWSFQQAHERLAALESP